MRFKASQRLAATLCQHLRWRNSPVCAQTDPQRAGLRRFRAAASPAARSPATQRSPRPCDHPRRAQRRDRCLAGSCERLRCRHCGPQRASHCLVLAQRPRRRAPHCPWAAVPQLHPSLPWKLPMAARCAMSILPVVLVRPACAWESTATSPKHVRGVRHPRHRQQRRTHP